MGFFDNATDMLDKGVAAAKGAVSSVGGEQLPFVRGLCRMCQDGFEFGYHEKNGGNASRWLTHEEANAARTFFYEMPSSWVNMGISAPQLGREYLLVTGTGKYLRNMTAAPVENAGIVELSPDGGSWRLVWGLKDGGMPTSELAAHILAYAACASKPGGPARVLYHAHPTALVALTALVPPDARTLTRLVWSMSTESVVAVPGGVGYLGSMVPGSQELARATAAELANRAACVWQLHGVMAPGADFDEAFGIVQTLDKAADAYLRARAAQGGNPNVPFTLDDGAIRATAARYGLPISEEFLG